MITDLSYKVNELRRNLSKVIRGKAEVIENLLIAFVAGGNVLLDDVPGLGKTTLAKALAQSVALDFRRIQFTPDLLPADIVGSSIFDMRSSQFEFRAGPVFTNVLLVDEINRASPRTQSALLEAMSERQVTVDGVTRKLAKTFFVIATQNPLEFQGTFPLPEAQLDRFAMQLSIGYPDEGAELALLFDREQLDPLNSISQVISEEDILSLQQECQSIRMERSVAAYLVALIRATREDDRLELGASPRALLILGNCARAAALLDDRDYVMPDDIKNLAGVVLAHRLRLADESRYSGISAVDIIEDIVKKIKMPI